MPVVGHPRTFDFRPIDRKRLVVLANSSEAYSVPAAEAYCRRRGIPLANIIPLSLGTSDVAFDPGDNAAISTAIVDPLAAKYAQVGAVGVLIAPGCPNGIVVRGVFVQGTGYLAPTATANAPLALLAAGARSFAARVAARGGFLAVTADPTVTNVRWSGTPVANLVPPTPLWNGFVWDFLGVGNDATMSPVTQLSDLFGPTATNTRLATVLATQTLSAGSPVIPAGRIGYTGWTSADGLETAANALGATDAADAAYGQDVQSGPILVGVREFSGYLATSASMYTRLKEWGFWAKYFWRQAPSGLAATLCPAGGPDEAFTDPDFDSGAVVGYPAMVHYDCSDNENPLTTAPYTNAIQPTRGGGAYLGGLSGGFQYSLRSLQRGAAWGVTDVTHRTAASPATSWSLLYLLLAGMTPLEAAYYDASLSLQAPMGDPLFAPFWYVQPSKYQTLDEVRGVVRRTPRTRAWRAPR